MKKIVATNFTNFHELIFEKTGNVLPQIKGIKMIFFHADSADLGRFNFDSELNKSELICLICRICVKNKFVKIRVISGKKNTQ